MADTARIALDGKELDLPVVRGSEGEVGVDIAALRSVSGVITVDPGYANTGSCRSGITFIDGERGVLRYRGIPIEQLAERSHFLETAMLLLDGELPTRAALDTFRGQITYHTMVHEDVRSFYEGFPKSAHPMAICGAVVGALSTFYSDSLDMHDERQVEISIQRLIAKLPTIVAYSYKHSIGQPLDRKSVV